MNISDLISGIKTVVSDVTSGSFLQAWRDALPLQEALISGIEELAGGLRFAPAPEEVAELQAAHDELDAAVKGAMKKKTFAAHDPIGKIGDGTLLANLLALLQVILPLIAPFLKTPTPTP